MKAEYVIKRDNYSGKAANTFTKFVDEVVDSQMKVVKEQFAKEVDATFIARAVTMAKEAFAKCLKGIQ